MNKEFDTLVSVVMSVYNGEKHLKESIESVLGQTFSNFEFIIVDDGSNDNSPQILERYRKKDSRIRIIHQENIGLTKSLNKAINLVQGEYIARQDVDDISLAERLEKQLNIFFKKPQTDLVASWYYIIEDKGEIIIERKLPNLKTVKRLLPFENLICHASVTFKKSTFFELEGYDEKLKYGQDKYMWMKMKNIEIIPEPLIKYRWHIGNITHARFKEKMKIEDYDYFLNERIICYFSSLLIQQGELKKARGLLKTHLRNPRHLFYYMLTFLPSWIIDIYMWRVRYSAKMILGLIFPYYRVIK